MKIGLFDSGIGGLTVLKVLKEKYPYNEYIYYGDTLNMPYGNKSPKELLTLAYKDIEFLINKKVDLIVIACGTISSTCFNILKKECPVPLVSIIDSTINYLNNSNYNNIGVIATSATINTHIFKNNINKNVYEIETPELVPAIESNNYDEIRKLLHKYLNKYINKIDCLVLGCTHYPIIIDYIRDILPSNIKIINMADLVVLDNNSNIQIYYSKISNNIMNNTKKILN